jgi:ABC-type branched-subunit amino acid transport system ATPase component
MTMLAVQGLRSGYGKIEVLHDVNLTIERGQIVTLIGANGAGKTTLLKTVSGLIRPMAGSIEFQGRSIVRVPAHKIVGLGLSQVPEGRAILKRMTVMDNLRMGAFTRRDPEIGSDIDAVFARFPALAERRNQLAVTLSGGEQQMLAIGPRARGAAQPAVAGRTVARSRPQVRHANFSHAARAAKGRQDDPVGRTECASGAAGGRPRLRHGARPDRAQRVGP